MWGLLGYKTEPEERIPLGYIDDMTPEMEECLKAFKEWIVEKGYNQNPWFNDMIYLKFCRARKFKLEAVKEMFENYMEYRKINNLDSIIGDFNFEKKMEVFNNYKRGYCGIDKIGRPIYIEQSGSIKPDEIFKVCDEDYLWRSYYQSYEIFLKSNLMACSLVSGKQIQHSLCIQDLTGFHMGMFGGQVKALVQKASQISQDYYPEMLGQLFIINAPYIFKGVWIIIQAWLDEKTRKKIQLMSTGHAQVLLELVDEDQLMEYLGGKNKANLADNIGPWNDYEVIDGSNPDDVVGIRKISDGPEGKIFTPKDLMALPNYLLDIKTQEEGKDQLEEEKS